MKAASLRTKSQVYSVGNYLMTGKVLGKGHFARVEEATHRIIGKKVAIKIIDLTSIKEEYARRNLHREPKVMAKLRHPCIAALYETMMHGPRLYVVMEAAGGGDLCAHVLAARGGARGLPEVRARALATQLVSAVRHMHSRGVVHRDLKMENIMLDTTKQFIKIVDFGLSNMWSVGGALRTPCGSLEYAAPELFIDGRRYGPEVDLWSIGVIVYGMVTGVLPFTCSEGGAGKSRPQLRAAITRGFTRKQRAALACVSTECKTFVQHLLEPNVDVRMKIEEASRHRWLRRNGMRMKTHPLGNLDTKLNKEIYKQLAELSGQPVTEIVAQITSDPFGPTAGMYNIKTHLMQLQCVPGTDLLWSSSVQEPRPNSPPKYWAKTELTTQERPETAPSSSKSSILPFNSTKNQMSICLQKRPSLTEDLAKLIPSKPNGIISRQSNTASITQKVLTNTKEILNIVPKNIARLQSSDPSIHNDKPKTDLLSPRFSRPLSNYYGLKKPVYKVYENGDCYFDPRLPSIDEHSNTDLNKGLRKTAKTTCVRKVCLDGDRPIRLNSCPKAVETKRSDFYRRAGDAIPNWRAAPARLLLQSNATSIKRASLGNIVSPHSSSNSHCKSERAMPVGWFSRNTVSKETTHLQRFRRTTPLK